LRFRLPILECKSVVVVYGGKIRDATK
jgi:hypothetical protein